MSPPHARPSPTARSSSLHFLCIEWRVFFLSQRKAPGVGASASGVEDDGDQDLNFFVCVVVWLKWWCWWLDERHGARLMSS